MKVKYLFIAFCLLCAGVCTAQKQLFDKYSDMDDVTYVYISKAMMSAVSSLTDMGIESSVAAKIESLQVLTTKDAKMASQMKNDFSQLVATDKYEELMLVREGKKSKIAFYSKKGKNSSIEGLIMLAASEKKYVAIFLAGTLTLSDVQKITKDINISESNFSE